MLEHIVQSDGDRSVEVDRSAAIADMRFDFIERLCEQTVGETARRVRSVIRSEKIDRILTGKYTAIPMLYRYYGACILSDL